MEWISVKDRLPEMNIEEGDFKTSEQVLGLFNNKESYWVESLTYKIFCDDDTPYWYYDYDAEFCETKNLTHWMPLPEPPKQ